MNLISGPSGPGLIVEWTAIAGCTVLVFRHRKWFVGSLILWLGSILSMALYGASDELFATCQHPEIVALFGLPFAMLFGWMELVILSFIFPSRFYDRSPTHNSRVGRNLVIVDALTSAVPEEPHPDARDCH